MPRGKQPGWHGRGVGLLLLLHVCLDPPHSGPAAASRGETEAPLSCDAAHPCWLQLWCPSQQEALVELLGMAWSHVEMTVPTGHLILGYARTGTLSSSASHGELRVEMVWGWHPSGFLAPFPS